MWQSGGGACNRHIRGLWFKVEHQERANADDLRLDARLELLENVVREFRFQEWQKTVRVLDNPDHHYSPYHRVRIIVYDHSNHYSPHFNASDFSCSVNKKLLMELGKYTDRYNEVYWRYHEVLIEIFT